MSGPDCAIPAGLLPAAAVQHTVHLAGWQWDDPALEAWTRRELPQALDRRRIEFAAGRLCAARAASHLLGRPVHPTEIPRAPTGGPVWPDGLIGSLAHCRHLAGAIAMPRAAGPAGGLGLDIEPIMSGERVAAVQRRIIRSDELQAMRATGPLSDAEATTIAFAVKEALFKCLHPLVGQMFFFPDATIAAVACDRVGRDGVAGESDLRVAMHLTTDLGAGMVRGRAFEAAVAARGAVVFAVVTV